MRAQTIVYPGSFDPITKGHVDLAERAAQLFDTVVIGIGISSKKQPLFSTEERLALAEAALSHLDNIRVECFSGLLTDFAKTQDSRCVLRGVRSVTDFEYETQMANMNRGKYLDANLVNAEPTEFCIGVAGYPEKHFEAPNFDTDLKYLKEKIDAGADYIVTQMFYDNEKYFQFVDKCRAIGIEVPIIPGLKPITKKYQLNSIPRKFFVNLPEEFVSEMEKADTKEAIRELGIEWCIKQSKELKERGAPVLHYYTMGDTDTILRIVRAIS